MPIVWIDTAAYTEALAELKRWATVIGPYDQPRRSWQESLKEADGALITARYSFDAALLAQTPRLRAIVRLGVGYDNVDLAAATAAGICVMNTPDAPAESTAEHTVGLLLALSKKICLADRRLRRGDWESRQQLVGVELKDKTLGIVGLGRIGGRVAEICRLGLKMRVLAYDPYLSASMIRQRYAEPVTTLPELLAQADAVTLHVPATPETWHMIRAETLAYFRRGALLINTSRGTVVNEADLIAALVSGQLAGAALDVFDPEPPAPDSPLFGMENVIATPHSAALTAEALSRIGLQAVEQLRQALHGERPQNLLNPEVWPRRRTQTQSFPLDSGDEHQTSSANRRPASPESSLLVA